MLFLSYDEALKYRNTYKKYYDKKLRIFMKKTPMANVNLDYFKDTIYSRDGANPDDLGKMRAILPDCVVNIVENAWGKHFEFSIPKGHSSNIVCQFTTEEEALKLAETVRKSGYTKKIGKAFMEYILCIPDSRYQFDNKYIYYSGGKYGVSVPQSYKEKFGSTIRTCNFETALKYRNEFKDKYTHSSTRLTDWAHFKHIEDEYIYCLGKKEPVKTSNLEGCIDWVTRLDSISKGRINKLLKRIEDYIIKDDSCDKSILQCHKDVQVQQNIERQDTEQVNIKAVEQDTRQSIEQDTVQSIEQNIENVPIMPSKESISTEVSVDEKKDYIILNRDTNTFLSIIATSTLDLLKEIVKLNTLNVLVLKKVDDSYIKIEVLS